MGTGGGADNKYLPFACYDAMVRLALMNDQRMD